MKKVFFLLIIYFIIISSCEYFNLMSKKEWEESVGKKDDVVIYVGGSYTDAPDYYPCYWKIKDGEIERIDVEYQDVLANSISSICAIDDKVYSCGFTYYNTYGFNRACYWINKKRYDLEVNNPYTGSTAYSIKVKNGVVFIGGDADGGACFWIGQNKSSININSAKTIFIQQSSSSKYEIYIGGSNLKTYVQACYWIDGNITDLPPLPDAAGETSEVWSNYVIGNIVYSAGTKSIDGPTEACLWKNSDLTVLPNGSTAFSVFVSSDDVYTAGVDSSGNNACYWKNNKFNILPSSGASNAQSIFVLNGNVYIAGTDNNYACCWINGNKKTLENTYNSYGISIFVTTDYK